MSSTDSIVFGIHAATRSPGPTPSATNAAPTAAAACTASRRVSSRRRPRSSTATSMTSSGAGHVRGVRCARQDAFRDVEPCPGEPGRVEHAVADERRPTRIRTGKEVPPRRRPEVLGLVDRPAVQPGGVGRAADRVGEPRQLARGRSIDRGCPQRLTHGPASTTAQPRPTWSVLGATELFEHPIERRRVPDRDARGDPSLEAVQVVGRGRPPACRVPAR